MKITGVQSLAPGTHQPLSPSEFAFPNVDTNTFSILDEDSTNESGVIVDSVENSPATKPDDRLESPLSPDQAVGSSDAQCVINREGAENPDSTIPRSKEAECTEIDIYQTSPRICEAGSSDTHKSSDVIMDYSESAQNSVVEEMDCSESPKSAYDAGQSETSQCPDIVEVVQSETTQRPDIVEVVQAETPQSPDIVEVAQAETPQSPDIVEVVQSETPQSPDFVEVVQSETTQSPDFVEVVQSETPQSPDFIEIVQSETPQSPDVEILDSPASPVPSSSFQSHFMKVRFEVPDASNSVSFTLDNQGTESSKVSMERKTDVGVDSSNLSSCRSDNSSKVFGTGMSDDWNRRKLETPPVYSVDSRSVLGNQQSTLPDNEKKTETQSLGATDRACFNCLGTDHIVSNCPKPANRLLIAKRRREFNSMSQEKNLRYHQIMPQSCFNSNFKPGVISDKLRSALRLKRNELPNHIYNMRIHGYPPGYLNQAIEASSSLTFYDGGDTVRRTVTSSIETQKEKLIKNLVDYPGFTSPVPPGYKEEGHLFDSPFNDKYTLDNLANQRLNAKSSVENREILSAKRTSVRHPMTSTSSCNSSLNPWSSHNQLTSSFAGHDGGQNEWQSNNASKKKDDGPKWYDDLFAPSPPTRVISDVEKAEEIYQKVLKKKAANPGRDFTDLQYDGFDTGHRNYRVTEELERREEEDKKMLAAKKQAEVNKKQRERELRERPSSPSLLDSFYETEEAVPSPICTTDKSSSTDDEVMIVEVTDKCSQSRKRALEEIIILDSDDEDTNKPVKKAELLLPNPLFKKPRLTDASKDPKVKVAPKTSQADKPDGQTKTNAVSPEKSNHLVFPRTEEEYHAKQTKDSNSNELQIPLSSSSVGSSCGQDESTSGLKLNKEIIMETLAKHSEGDESVTYSSLPPMDNFAIGMSELPLQEEAIQFSGRWQKVVGILHKKKADKDDDIQIID